MTPEQQALITKAQRSDADYDANASLSEQDALTLIAQAQVFLTVAQQNLSGL